MPSASTPSSSSLAYTFFTLLNDGLYLVQLKAHLFSGHVLVYKNCKNTGIMVVSKKKATSQCNTHVNELILTQVDTHNNLRTVITLLHL